MASILKPKRRSTDATAPTTANLADGEVAINAVTKTIYQRIGAAVVAVANYFTDAPSDGTTYGRKDGAWVAAGGGGGAGITWSVSGSASTLAADTAQIVTAAVNKTLPATTSAGQQFIVHAKVDGVRIVSNGNLITGVGSGNDLTLLAGETAHLVVSSSGNLEIV